MITETQKKVKSRRNTEKVIVTLVQIYAEPHKSYENVKNAGASPISEADF
jgi:hypothetical protein